MFAIKLLVVFIVCAVVGYNFEKIFFFLNDLLNHGMAAIRKKLGMEKTEGE